MSRTRNRSELLNNCSMTWMQGEYSTYHSGSAYGCFVDRLYDESMTDELSPGNRRLYHMVSHQKMQAAKFVDLVASQQAMDTYYPPPGTYSTRSWRYRFAISPSTVVIKHASNIDWLTLLVSMADSVKGFIQSKSLVAVSLLELRKTWEMVRNPFSLLRPDWRLRVGNSTAKYLAKRGSNIWLEGQYGWNATFVDLKNFVSSSVKHWESCQRFAQREQLQRFGNQTKTCGSAQSPTMGDAEWSSKVSMATSSTLWRMGPVMRIIFNPPVTTARLTCWATDSVARHVSDFRKVLQTYGLDYTQILATLWEVIPYSFVVDWFVNMESMMNLPRLWSSLDTLKQAQVQQLGHSRKTTVDFTAYLLHTVAAGTPSWYTWYNTVQPFGPVLSTAKGTITLYDREGDLPELWPSVFTGKGLNLSKLTSGVSLITQRLR